MIAFSVQISCPYVGPLRRIIYIYVAFARENGYIYIPLYGVKYLLGVKVIYLIDGTDLFRVRGLILGEETIATNLHSSLRETERGRDREREGSDRERRMKQSVSCPGCDKSCLSYTEASSAKMFSGTSIQANTCKL
jgi:hypothetical protein